MVYLAESLALATQTLARSSSALLTLIEFEKGAGRVEEVLAGQASCIPWLCLLEVRYVTLQERGTAEANQRYALLKALPSTLLWDSSEAVLLSAARFKARYQLSLTDAIIAAYALAQGAVLVHKDPEYEVLSEVLELEALPYIMRGCRLPGLAFNPASPP